MKAQVLPDILVNHDGFIQGIQDTSGPAGGVYTYRAKVKLNTGDDAQGVVLKQTLPVGAIFQSITPSGSDIKCPGAPAAGILITAANQNISCNLGTVSFDFKWVDFNVVLPTVSSTWTAMASASLPSGPVDGDGGTNNVNLARNFTTNDATDFGIRISPINLPADGVENGKSYGYQIDVTNYGPTALPNGGFARVVFEVPSGAPVTAMPAGTGWSCSASGPFPLAKGMVTCDYTNPLTGSYTAGSPLPPISVPVLAQMSGPIGAAVSVEGFQTAGLAMADGRKDNNTASVIVQSAGSDYADVSLTKAASPALIDSKVSTVVTYTLQVRRLSGSLSPNLIRVEDVLPAGMSFLAFQGSNDARWLCSSATGTISCYWDGNGDRVQVTDINDVSDAYTGGNNSNLPAIKFTVNVPGQASGTTLTNAASVALADGQEPDISNNKDSATVTFSNRAQPAVQKSGPSDAILKGEEFEYTIVVKNDGPMPINVGDGPISVKDTPSAGLKLLRVNAAAGSAGWTCTVPPSGVAGAPVTCENSSALAVGEQLKLVIVATVDGLDSEYVRFGNSAEVGVLPGRTSEWVNHTAQVYVSDGEADLTLTKEVLNPAAVYKSGDLVTYRLTVTNKSTSSLNVQGAKVTDQLTNLLIANDGGAGLHSAGGFVSAVVVGALPTYQAGRVYGGAATYPAGTTQASCGTPTRGASSRDRTLTCDIDFLAPGASVSFDVTIRHRVTEAQPTAKSEVTYTNKASVQSPFINEPTPADNEGSASVKMTTLVDLTVEKQVSPALEVAAGQPATYTVTTKNLGPSSAQNVVMLDNLPANSMLVGEPEAAGGGTCTHSGGAPMNGLKGGVLTCTWPALAAQSQHVVTYKSRFEGGNPQPTDTMVNDVAVSTDTEETDYTNNTDAVSIKLKPAELDVQVQMSHSADGLLAGESTVYTITIKNDASSNSYATKVNLTELFPAAGSTATFSYQGGLSLRGMGTSKLGYVSGVTGVLPSTLCTTEPAIGATSGPLICEIPLMAPGDSVNIMFTLKAESLKAGAKTGTVFHSATVTPAETEYMPLYDALANNSTEDRTSTSNMAIDTDIGVEKSGPAGQLRAGDTVVYTLTVINSGRRATTVQGTVTDLLPADLTYVSHSSPAGATCTVPALGSTGTVHCVVPPMAVGQRLTYTVTTEVPSTYVSGAIVNKATVNHPDDTNPDNDESITTHNEPPPTDIAGIPTLSQWGLAFMSLVLGLFGVATLRLVNVR